MSAIYRWDSGYPFDGYYDQTGWQTNWEIRSYMTADGHPATGVNVGVSAPGCITGCSLPNMFADPAAAAAAFRTPHPGETGSRNALRYPWAQNLDAALAKSFDMPWKEGHRITIRWEVFNVTNSPYFTGQANTLLPYTGTPPSGQFGQYTATRNDPRVMQFAFRYDF